MPPHGAPQGLGGLVVHELVGAVEKAAGAKRVVHSLVLGVVEDHGAAERAVHARDRHPPDRVDEHLVPAEDALRVGPGVAVDRDAEHDVVVVEVSDVARGEHRRIAQRRDAVLPDAAPDDLVEPDQRLAHLVEVRREARIEEAVERALEGGVARVPNLGRVPHRTLPCAEVVTVLLAGLDLDEPQQGGRDRGVANEAHHVERHRQVGRLPCRLDESHGVHDVPFLPGHQSEERAGDAALGDFGARGRGRSEQDETEDDDEGTDAGGGHGESPKVCVGCRPRLTRSGSPGRRQRSLPQAAHQFPVHARVPGRLHPDERSERRVGPGQRVEGNRRVRVMLGVVGHVPCEEADDGVGMDGA